MKLLNTKGYDGGTETPSYPFEGLKREKNGKEIRS